MQLNPDGYDYPNSAYQQACDTIKALREELARWAWKDISSAPRDGTWVLLWAPHWPAPHTGWTFGTDPWQDCPKDSYAKPPSHWQPLPSPPLIVEGDGASCTDIAMRGTKASHSEMQRKPEAGRGRGVSAAVLAEIAQRYRWRRLNISFSGGRTSAYMTRLLLDTLGRGR